MKRMTETAAKWELEAAKPEKHRMSVRLFAEVNCIPFTMFQTHITPVDGTGPPRRHGEAFSVPGLINVCNWLQSKAGPRCAFERSLGRDTESRRASGCIFFYDDSKLRARTHLWRPLDILTHGKTVACLVPCALLCGLWSALYNMSGYHYLTFER